MRVRVVFGEDARAIVNGQDEDGRHAEEGEWPRHGVCGNVGACLAACRRRGGFGVGHERTRCRLLRARLIRCRCLARLEKCMQVVVAYASYSQLFGSKASSVLKCPPFRGRRWPPSYARRPHSSLPVCSVPVRRSRRSHCKDASCPRRADVMYHMGRLSRSYSISRYLLVMSHAKFKLTVHSDKHISNRHSTNMSTQSSRCVMHVSRAIYVQ